MRLKLDTKITGPTIIVGFPGLGLVGPIVIEFLTDHLKTQRVGTFSYDELPPTVVIHKGTLVHPMCVHYSKEKNLLLFYTLLNPAGNEWKLAAEVARIASEMKAKQVIAIDAANAMDGDENAVFAFNDPALLSLGAKPMNESVIGGTTGALLVELPSTKCVFASAQQQIQDAKAAAGVVKLLSKHLSLGVDEHPLLEQAAQFETKLKSLIEQGKKLMQAKEDGKDLGYLG
jgi:uncharacterized protein